MTVLVQIRQAVAAIERNIPFADDAHYYLSAPNGGGYSRRFTLEEAVEEALCATGDECDFCKPALVLSNTATQDLALFYDGRAFLPAELLPVKSQPQ